MENKMTSDINFCSFFDKTSQILLFYRSFTHNAQGLSNVKKQL